MKEEADRRKTESSRRQRGGEVKRPRVKGEEVKRERER